MISVKIFSDCFDGGDVDVNTLEVFKELMSGIHNSFGKNFFLYGSKIHVSKWLTVGDNVTFYDNCDFESIINIGDNSIIGNSCLFHSKINIGKNCKIGDYVEIYENVNIGQNVKIGNNVTVMPNCKIPNNISIKDYVTVDQGCNFTEYSVYTTEYFLNNKIN